MTISLHDTGDELFEAGLPGMDADINISSIVTYINGTGQLLEAGTAVGVDDENKLCMPEPGNVVGIIVRHVIFGFNESSRESYYRENDPVPVMEFGRIWATAPEGTVGREQVTTDADGTVGVGGAIPIDGAFWDTQSEAGGVAIARLNRIKFPASGGGGGGEDTRAASTADKPAADKPAAEKKETDTARGTGTGSTGSST
jgi:hypothetical protein